MKIESSYSLLHFNTLGIDAVAEFFAQASSIDELRECLAFAVSNQLLVKVLGGGSNVVMASHIKGLVLNYSNTELQVVNETEAGVTIKVGAGYNWHEFVLFCLSQGWFGLENLSYIPGTVGAAPVQNIGAYGVEVKDFISSVHGIRLPDGGSFMMPGDSCGFAYRESCFKWELDGKVLITDVVFTLSKKPCVQVGYAPLDKMAKEKGLPSPSELSDWVVQVRKSKLPDPGELPNAGSFFKNPVVSEDQFQELTRRFPAMPNYPQSDGVKLPAGWMIDNLGMKGHSFGLVHIHALQALVLINNGGTSEDVIAAANIIKESVQKAYGVQLEQEPRIFA